MVNGKIIVFSASRLVVKNGLKYLIKALEYLPENYVVMIAGSGKLERKLKRQAFGKRVIFLGWIEQKDLAQYYQVSDVFCRPSLSEGLGNVFLEAIGLAGLPCVAPNIMGIKDIFDDFPKMMFDCGVKNPKRIAEKIQEAYKKLGWKRCIDDGQTSISNFNI